MPNLFKEGKMISSIIMQIYIFVYNDNELGTIMLVCTKILVTIT